MLTGALNLHGRERCAQGQVRGVQPEQQAQVPLRVHQRGGQASQVRDGDNFLVRLGEGTRRQAESSSTHHHGKTRTSLCPHPGVWREEDNARPHTHALQRAALPPGDINHVHRSRQLRLPVGEPLVAQPQGATAASGVTVGPASETTPTTPKKPHRNQSLSNGAAVSLSPRPWEETMHSQSEGRIQATVLLAAVTLDSLQAS